MWLDNTQGVIWNGRTITVEFSDLRDLDKGPDDNIVVAGKWLLSWPLSYMDQMQTYNIEKTYSVNGCQADVKSVAISPLSMSFELSGRDLKQLIDHSDLNEAGGLCSVSLLKKDGSTVEEGPRVERYWVNTYTQIIRFSQVQDMDQLDGFILKFYHEAADNTVTVTLPYNSKPNNI